MATQSDLRGTLDAAANCIEAIGAAMGKPLTKEAAQALLFLLADEIRDGSHDVLVVRQLIRRMKDEADPKLRALAGGAA